MLCVLDDNQRWFMNDGFSSGRYGILARAVHDPMWGYWQAYQNGMSVVEVESDANHRVYIQDQGNGFTLNVNIDTAVTSNSKYPEINWEVEFPKVILYGMFADVDEFRTG